MPAVVSAIVEQAFANGATHVSMHIAVVLTLFVSMTLVGLGVLLNQQRAIATEYLGNQLEIAATDSSSSGTATNARRSVSPPNRRV